MAMFYRNFSCPTCTRDSFLVITDKKIEQNVANPTSAGYNVMDMECDYCGFIPEESTYEDLLAKLIEEQL